MLLSTILQQRKSELPARIAQLTLDKQRNIEAIRRCDIFISASTWNAIDPFSFSFFGHMRNAAEVIPAEFEHLDTQDHTKGVDTRVQPYIRSQLFIALVSEVEDFFSTALTFVLEAHPEKVQDKSITLEELLAFGDVQGAISYCVKSKVNGWLYEKPLDYRKRIEQMLMMPNAILDTFWNAYVELKARRDVGVHGNWRQNETYARKLSDANITPPTSNFLGIDSVYFAQTVITCNDMISACNQHCQTRFAVVPPQQTNLNPNTP